MILPLNENTQYKTKTNKQIHKPNRTYEIIQTLLAGESLPKTESAVGIGLPFATSCHPEAILTSFLLRSDKYKILNSSAQTSGGFSSAVSVLEEKPTRRTD